MKKLKKHKLNKKIKIKDILKIKYYKKGTNKRGGKEKME